jgi:hypothetical protein
MTRFQARLSRWWSFRLGWYPTVDEIARLRPDALMALRAATTARVEGAVLTLLGFGAYCIVALESPDGLLLMDSPSVSLPFVQNEVSFAGFLVVGPLLLLGIWTYLHLLIMHRRLETAALKRQTLPLPPDLSEGRHPFLRVVVGAAYLGVAPLVMLDFTYKSAAIPGYGVWMMLASLMVIWSHVVAAARTMRSVRAQFALNLVVSGLVVVLLARCWVIGDEIVRPYNLYRADLSGAFLPKANLRGAYAARANFEGAILIDADLTGVYLGNARMSGADLSGATVTGAYFGWTDLKNANLSRADLSRSRFVHADLRDANLVSANLSAAYISGVNWEKAVLDFARLDGATIENSNFRDASLRQASLDGVRDRDANLTGPSLAPANGVTLSVEQQGQLERKIEARPIYDRDGNIIGDDREREFSREKLDKFYEAVEGGSRPSTGGGVETPSPPGASPAPEPDAPSP